MILLNFLASCAVLYFIMMFIMGENALPSFRAAALYIFISVLLSYVALFMTITFIAFWAYIVAFIVQAAVIAFLFKTDLKQTALACGIYQVYAFLANLVWTAILS